MNKIPINDAWNWWFRREKSITGFQYELEGLIRLIELEKKYPTKGDMWLRSAIKKRMIVQYKIKSLTLGR